MVRPVQPRSRHVRQSVAITGTCVVGLAISLAGCGSSPSGAPSPSATSSAAPACLPPQLRTLLKPDQEIVSARCEQYDGVQFAAGVVKNPDGSQAPFYAVYAGGKWERTPEAELCGSAAPLTQTKQYCNGGKADDSNFPLGSPRAIPGGAATSQTPTK